MELSLFLNVSLIHCYFRLLTSSLTGNWQVGRPNTPFAISGERILFPNPEPFVQPSRIMLSTNTSEVLLALIITISFSEVPLMGRMLQMQSVFKLLKAFSKSMKRRWREYLHLEIICRVSTRPMKKIQNWNQRTLGRSSNRSIQDSCDGREHRYTTPIFVLNTGVFLSNLNDYPFFLLSERCHIPSISV